jgi:hypothetical protein
VYVLRQNCRAAGWRWDSVIIIIYLGTQELAFGGHNENENSFNQGNFRQLAKLLSGIMINLFKQFLDESTIFTGLSKTIQNINNVITITVEDEVKCAPCFSWQT